MLVSTTPKYATVHRKTPFPRQPVYRIYYQPPNTPTEFDKKCSNMIANASLVAEQKNPAPEPQPSVSSDEVFEWQDPKSRYLAGYVEELSIRNDWFDDENNNLRRKYT